MTKRSNGAGVNRMAARKASEVRAGRLARLAAHEKDIEATVGMFFDRSGRADQVRMEAQVKAERILAEAAAEAQSLAGEADEALVKLKTLGEPVVEIASMTGLAVSGVRAALIRAGSGTRDT